MRLNENRSMGSIDMKRTQIFYGRTKEAVPITPSPPPSTSRRGINNCLARG